MASHPCTRQRGVASRVLHLEAAIPREPGSGDVQSSVSQMDRQASNVLQRSAAGCLGV